MFFDNISAEVGNRFSFPFPNSGMLALQENAEKTLWGDADVGMGVQDGFQKPRAGSAPAGDEEQTVGSHALKSCLYDLIGIRASASSWR